MTTPTPYARQHPEFRLLLGAQTISTLGDALTNLTLVLLINHLTHSVQAIALLTALIALPDVVIGLMAGVAADRMNRRTLMLWSDGLRALLVLGFMVVYSSSMLWVIYLLACVQASIGSFFNPARAALLQTLLPEEQRLEANGLLMAGGELAEMLGTAAAGVLVGLTKGYGAGFAVDALTFLTSFLLVSRIRSRPVTHDHLTTPAGELLEGLRLFQQTAVLKTCLVCFGLMLLGATAVQVLYVPLAVNQLHIPVVWMGLLGLAQGVGIVLGGGVLSEFIGQLNTARLVTWALFGFAGCLLLITFAPNVWWLAAVNLLFGTLLALLQSGFMTLVQNHTGNAAMGRVGSVFGLVGGLAGLFGMSSVAMLAAHLNVREIFMIVAALVSLSGVYAHWAFRTLKHNAEITAE